MLILFPEDEGLPARIEALVVAALAAVFMTTSMCLGWCTLMDYVRSMGDDVLDDLDRGLDDPYAPGGGRRHGRRRGRLVAFVPPPRSAHPPPHPSPPPSPRAFVLVDNPRGGDYALAMTHAPSSRPPLVKKMSASPEE